MTAATNGNTNERQNNARRQDTQTCDGTTKSTNPPKVNRPIPTEAVLANNLRKPAQTQTVRTCH